MHKRVVKNSTEHVFGPIFTCIESLSKGIFFANWYDNKPWTAACKLSNSPIAYMGEIQPFYDIFWISYNLVYFTEVVVFLSSFEETALSLTFFKQFVSNIEALIKNTTAPTF